MTKRETIATIRRKRMIIELSAYTCGMLFAIAMIIMVIALVFANWTIAVIALIVGFIFYIAGFIFMMIED